MVSLKDTAPRKDNNHRNSVQAGVTAHESEGLEGSSQGSAALGFTVIFPGGCRDTLLTVGETPENTSKEQLENRTLELSY